MKVEQVERFRLLDTINGFYTCNISKVVCNYFLNRKGNLGESQFLKL